jgi:RHS repeat-associated protein
VTVSYNRLGQEAVRVDQRGVTRVLNYDKRGRLTDDRVTNFQRGELNTIKDAIKTGTTASRTQSFTLDPLGNWGNSSSSSTTGVTNDGTGQSRTHNSQNQATAVAGATLTYDNNGNVTKDETGKGFFYDAWNRLDWVKTTPTGSTLALYTFDALGRRITRSDAVLNQMFYSGRQVIEERDDPYSPTTVAQNVWSLAYTDALVLRDIDADLSSSTGNYGKTSSGLELRMYAQQDANWNVTSIVGLSGTWQVLERYKYDPYGAVTIMTGSWGSRSSSSYNWVYFHQGGRFDPGSKLYHFDNRELSPTLGRWMQQDPLGYADGLSLYQAYASGPSNGIDPFGTLTISRGGGTNGVIIGGFGGKIYIATDDCGDTYLMFNVTGRVGVELSARLGYDVDKGNGRDQMGWGWDIGGFGFGKTWGLGWSIGGGYTWGFRWPVSRPGGGAGGGNGSYDPGPLPPSK